MTTKQTASSVASIVVLAATLVGAWFGAHPGEKPPPGAAQTSQSVVAVTAPTTIATPGSVVSDTVYRWPGTIAADIATGNLRSDLGWVNPRLSAPPRVVYCDVATRTAPLPYTRIMTAPNSPIVGKAAYVWTDCQRAFHQWDSLETKTGGKWPAGL